MSDVMFVTLQKGLHQATKPSCSKVLTSEKVAYFWKEIYGV